MNAALLALGQLAPAIDSAQRIGSAAAHAATLYVDGIARATATTALATMAALTHCNVGGLATAYPGVDGSALMAADFTIHLSALSASTILTRADVCRRMVGG